MAANHGVLFGDRQNREFRPRMHLDDLREGDIVTDIAFQDL